jgi:PelA/Pel-15E family pectate lyase
VANSSQYATYSNSQVIEIAENILRYQNPDGGWSKNIDLVKILSEAEIQELQNNPQTKGPSTLDNDNTYTQIEYLAKVFTQTKQDRYRLKYHDSHKF